MGKISCPNCGDTKWDSHNCKYSTCDWRVCRTCKLLADLPNARVCLDGEPPIFIDLRIGP